MSKKKTVVARRKPVARKSTALAVRKPASQVELVINDTRALPAVAAPVQEHVQLGGHGLSEVVLTEREEAVLSEKVPLDEVLIKPTKEGTIYLSHPSYTRWFNRAFGRLGWALVPNSEPKTDGGMVMREFTLFIHRHPVAVAIGEQEYRGPGSGAENRNNQQTYGDAIEACNASALRRCAKRLGVGLELWDKRWASDFLDTHGVLVFDDNKPVWRRKDDRPFWWETKQRQQAAPQPRQAPPREFINERTGEVTTSRPLPSAPRPAAAVPHVDRDGDVVITPAQVTRLQTILSNSKREKTPVKAWMWIAYGYASSKDIKRKHYEAICAAIERSGPLPIPTDSDVFDSVREREPGEEG